MSRSFFLAIIFFSLLTRPALSDEGRTPSTILFISSASDSNRAFAMERAFTERWQESEAAATVFHFLHYSYALPSSNAASDSACQYLKERFALRPPNLIIAQADFGANFALYLRDNVFPQTPILAFDMTPGAKTFLEAAESLYIMEHSFPDEKNIKLATTLFPRRQHIVIFLISEPEFTSSAEIETAVMAAHPELSFQVLPNPTMADADAVIPIADSNTLILNFFSGWTDPSGRHLTGKAFIEHVVKRYQVPVFEYVRENLGQGSVGGVGVSAESWGRAAAEIGLEIVLAKKLVPFVTSSLMFDCAFGDYQVMKAFGVRPRDVPEDLELINLPPDFWNRYRLIIQLTIAVLIIAILYLLGRAWIRRRERRFLVQAKHAMEQEVSERTAELSRSNQELAAVNENLVALMRRNEAMQESVLRSAREITLGRLSYGFANGLNSPLAAARSAISSFRSLVGDGDKCHPSFPLLLIDLDAKQRALFEQNAAKVLSLAASTGLQTETDRVKLTEQLKKLGCTDASGTALDLVDSGLYGLANTELAAFANDRARPVARALYILSALERSITIIEEAIEKSISTVKAMRDYVTDSEAEDSPVKVKLLSTIERAILLFKSQLIPPIILKTEFQPVPLVSGTESRYVRLWAHLIQNSIQAMPKGGELSIKLFQESNWAVIEVADQGCGISEEIAEKLFEPFVTTRDIAEGMGLGLPSCKRIVESYDGDISFSSSPGRTVFRVRLPIIGAST